MTVNIGKPLKIFVLVVATTLSSFSSVARADDPPPAACQALANLKDSGKDASLALSLCFNESSERVDLPPGELLLDHPVYVSKQNLLITTAGNTSDKTPCASNNGAACARLVRSPLFKISNSQKPAQAEATSAESALLYFTGSNITIKNLVIDGTKSTQNSAESDCNTDELLRWQSCKNCLGDSLVLRHNQCGTAASIITSDSTMIKDSIFTENGSGARPSQGVAVLGGNKIIIIGNYFENGSSTDIYAQDSHEILIASNVSLRSGSALGASSSAVRVLGGSGTLLDNLVDCEGNSCAAAFVLGSVLEPNQAATLRLSGNIARNTRIGFVLGRDNEIQLGDNFVLRAQDSLICSGRSYHGFTVLEGARLQFLGTMLRSEHVVQSNYPVVGAPLEHGTKCNDRKLEGPLLPQPAPNDMAIASAGWIIANAASAKDQDLAVMAKDTEHIIHQGGSFLGLASTHQSDTSAQVSKAANDFTVKPSEAVISASGNVTTLSLQSISKITNVKSSGQKASKTVIQGRGQTNSSNASQADMGSQRDNAPYTITILKGVSGDVCDKTARTAKKSAGSKRLNITGPAQMSTSSNGTLNYIFSKATCKVSPRTTDDMGGKGVDTIPECPVTIAFLGARNKTGLDDVKKLLSVAKEEGCSIGFKYFEGGIFAQGVGGAAVDIVATSSYVHTLTVAATFARPRTTHNDTLACYESVEDEVNKAKKLMPILRMAKENRKRLYYVPCTEDNERDGSLKTKVAAALNEEFIKEKLDVKLINNPLEPGKGSTAGNKTREGFDLLEYHGSLPTIEPNCSFDPDGSEVDTYIKSFNRAKECELNAVWTASYNCGATPSEARDRKCSVDWSEVRGLLRHIRSKKLTNPPH